MTTISQLEKELATLKKRNHRVDTDKAWETSWTRKTIIAILTYGVVVLFFYSAKLPHPFLNAIVPSGAFLLSTLTLSYVKTHWIRHQE